MEIDKTILGILDGKALYSPKGAALEYAAVGCNFYKGCPHACEYCYLKRGVLSHELGSTEVKLKACFKDEIHAMKVFVKELEADLEYIRQTGVFFSFSTDPMIDETRDLTLSAVIECLAHGVPVKILTKNASFLSDKKFVDFVDGLDADVRRNVAFGFTLTGRDDMEPHASPNYERIHTMKLLHQLSFRTFASIEPIIDFDSSFRMIQDSALFCDHFKIGLRSGVKDDYYNPDECAYFVGKVTGLCEQSNFTVYWKESMHKYVRKHMAKDNFEVALSSSNHFVDMDYDIFKEGSV